MSPNTLVMSPTLFSIKSKFCSFLVYFDLYYLSQIKGFLSPTQDISSWTKKTNWFHGLNFKSWEELSLWVFPVLRGDYITLHTNYYCYLFVVTFQVECFFFFFTFLTKLKNFWKWHFFEFYSFLASKPGQPSSQNRHMW